MIMNLKEAGGGPVCHGIEHRGSYSARKEANNTGETEERGHNGKLSGPCTAQSPVPFLDPTLAPAFLCIPWSWKESDFFFLVKVES